MVKNEEKIVILDFYGQYNQLIARRVRECNVYCEVMSYKNDIEKIKAKSPEAEIIIQSVTPMTSDSPIKGSKLNNTVIAQFNERMLALCQERGWYYVDIAQAVYDENKDLKRSYCSDPAAMGIHFNYEADKAWINYLITHAPEI